MSKNASAIGGGSSVAAIVATLGWPGAAMIVGLCVVVLGLAAWVVADSSRSGNLVMLILALRGGSSRLFRKRDCGVTGPLPAVRPNSAVLQFVAW